MGDATDQAAKKCISALGRDTHATFVCKSGRNEAETNYVLARSIVSLGSRIHR